MRRDRHLARGNQIDFPILPGAPFRTTANVMSLRIPVGTTSFASSPSIALQPDPGDGTYRNPILHADYSDPDAIRVGEDFWLVSSSFSHVPGLPILHSTDLVNWQLVAHAFPGSCRRRRSPPRNTAKASGRRRSDIVTGKFWIYYPDPDFGLYLVTAADPRGPWSPPVLVKSGRGLIDPCPLWDEDGSVYLIHGWAKSRAGISPTFSPC